MTFVKRKCLSFLCILILACTFIPPQRSGSALFQDQVTEEECHNIWMTAKHDPLTEGSFLPEAIITTIGNEITFNRYDSPLPVHPSLEKSTPPPNPA